jgi:two-component sensor histidine kinase/CheY-like chemotaxis protein
MQLEGELVLVVDDNEPGRYATARILTRAGLTVLEAGTGAEALRLAREHKPPVVVLDINLPDINGVEVCRRLKAEAETASILVLQVSATNIGVADRVESLRAGADTFLVEPVEAEELEAVTRALLRLHKTESALRQSLAERELLLKEVNHRVKNSLQLVMSMLSLQSQEFSDPTARGLFAKAVSRVSAIASVHERLYQADDPLSVEMRGYLSALLGEISRAGREEFKLTVDVEPVRLPTEHGVSLALIINELVMNAIKHGLPADETPHITVRLMRVGADEMRLTVADNGASKLSESDEQAGFGTRLIDMLARQLRGRLEIDNTQGYSVHMTFRA